MASPERKIRKLLRRASPVRLAFVFFFVLAMVPVSIAIRYYALETIFVEDSALAPEVQENTLAFFCKWKTCTENFETGDYVLFHLHDGTPIVRKILATPGSNIHVTAGGFLSVNDSKPILIKNEGVFIANRDIYVPKKDDVLYLDSLSDVEFDYALNVLDLQGITHTVTARPYLGDEELPLAFAGNTRIGSRPTSIRELPGLPWQELYLISLQIRRYLHASQMVHFKREAFLSERVRRNFDSWTPEPDTLLLDTLPMFLDSLLSDSLGDSAVVRDSLVQTDSLANVDSTELVEEQVAEIIMGNKIDSVAVPEDMYYVITPNAERAADSREFGYIPKNKIVGKLVFELNASDLKINEIKMYLGYIKLFIKSTYDSLHETVSSFLK